MNFYRLLILVFLISIQSCSGQQTKINGISFVAANDSIDASHIDPVTKINANYATIMPFGFTRTIDHPELVFNTDRQWFGETVSGAKQYIKTLQERKIKIMLKPQIWVWRGEFTGYIEMQSEEDWQVFETSYSKFIKTYAVLAEELNVEIFCIGTELETFVSARPNYWKQLISEIKTIYKGKLTYAANWDEFKRTPFWNELDYIGVDAYFPISDSKTPSVAECLEGWKLHKETIKSLHDKHNKQILFTEFGYRSVDYAGKEPWKSDRSMTNVNLESQANTTQSLFDCFWKEDWFAGGFLWKWFHNYNHVGGTEDTQFTPQNKPVEKLIKNHFMKYN